MEAYLLDTNKKVFLVANGCPENRNDLARMQKYIEQYDFVQTNDFQEADLLLFNSCGLTKRSENLSINIIKQLKANKKDSAQLIVYGCLPKINKERLNTVYNGITFGSDEVEKISTVIQEPVKSKDVYANYLQPCTTSLMKTQWKLKYYLKQLNLKIVISQILKTLHRPYFASAEVFHPNSFIIKVSTGCLGNCSFCAVKISRGSVVSKAIQSISKEFEIGLTQGYTEFSLIGTDLGSYGLDIKTNLVKLLKVLTNYKGNYELRLRNVHPKYLIKYIPELEEVFNTGKITFLSISAESGSNRILKMMNRGYTVEEYINAINTIKSINPNITIRNQLLVGFPGETEKDFEETLKLFDKINIDMTEVHMFSPRPNTIASEMPNRIPKNILMKRYNTLLIKSVLHNWQEKINIVRKQKKIIADYSQKSS